MQKRTFARTVACVAGLVLTVEVATAQQPPDAASRPRFELGLNALQGGVFEGGEWRGRVYDTVEVLLGSLRIGHYGINEAGPDYRFGQNTVSLGLADAPGVALIVAAKHDNDDGTSLALAQSGYGVRIDDRFVSLPWGLYYNLQLFKNTGHGSTASRDLEAILLLGRSFSGNDLSVLVDWERHDDTYLELEAISRGLLETPHSQLRLWARVEGTDADDACIGAGLHLQAR